MSSLLALLLLLLQMSFPTGSLPVVVVDHKDGRKDGNNDGNKYDNKDDHKDDSSNKLIAKLHATKFDPSDGASSPVPEFKIAVHSDLAKTPNMPEIISMTKTWDHFERQHAFDLVLGQLLKQIQNGKSRDLKREQEGKQRRFSQVQENQEEKERKHPQEKGDQDKTSGQWQRKWYKRIG